MSRFTSPIFQPDKRQTSIIIPCAGMGSRMKSYGPKALINIRNNLTIFENQVRHINKYFSKPQIILVTGFGHDKIIKKIDEDKFDIVHNHNWENTNVCKSIGLGLSNAKYNNVLIIYGDLVFNGWTLRVPFGNQSMLLMENEEGFMKKEEVGCVCHDNIIENVMYGLENKWAQIGYFTNKELNMLKEYSSKKENEQCYGFEAINNIISEGGTFQGFSPHRMKITDVDSSRDLVYVEDILCK